MSKLPVISGKELVNALEKAGFAVVRQKGSQVSLQKITELTEQLFLYIQDLLREHFLIFFIKLA
jgi:hypothetical protein